MTKAFTINDCTLTYDTQGFPLSIASFPYPYQVRSISSSDEYRALASEADFIIIDQNVARLYPLETAPRQGVYIVSATEENKTMDTVLSIIEALIDKNVSKGSKVVAIGGGIIQDLSACACALFRRGQPFIYLPTTSLGQLDSCVGAKCAMNTSRAKNIIGLFSAPREVVIPTFMVKSMPLNEHRAGLSEMLRLCLTASWQALDDYIRLFPSIAFPDSLCSAGYIEAVALSLSIKKAVVEFDEYERDVRRSMNYGHTFGHAIEKLADFAIPHGLGVLLGMHMANTYAFMSEVMDREIYERVCAPIRMTIVGTELNNDVMDTLDARMIIDQFRYDKKGDGLSVPLILIQGPGDMIFYRYRFTSASHILVASIEKSLVDFRAWTCNQYQL